MEELDIKLLERRVDELIRALENLKDENASLKQSHASLLSERAKLIKKTELARIRVEAMITRLKALEENA